MNPAGHGGANMQKEFWINKWENKQIGFHQSEINSYLQRHWKETGAATGAGVFVPLCGKTSDMLWLQQQGHAVTGVEFSETAVGEFFAENDMTPEISNQGAFDVSAANGIRLFCGDFFALTAQDLKGVTAVYDRAALIALPPETRKKYVAHLKALLPQGFSLLLVTLEYPQEAMDGPPFCVTEEDVAALFQGASPKLLERAEIPTRNERLRESGVETLFECVYRISVTG